MPELFLNLRIEALPEGGFLATSDQVPALIAQGRTIAETMEIAQDVARKLYESYVEHGDPMPAAFLPYGGPVDGGLVKIPFFVGQAAA